MDPNSFASYEALVGPKKHNVLKSRFSSMKFQLLGNAALVDYIIRFNLCGAVQPTALCAFCNKWANYTNSDDHKKAKKLSEARELGYVRKRKADLDLEASDSPWALDRPMGGWELEQPAQPLDI